MFRHCFYYHCMHVCPLIHVIKTTDGPIRCRQHIFCLWSLDWIHSFVIVVMGDAVCSVQCVLMGISWKCTNDEGNGRMPFYPCSIFGFFFKKGCLPFFPSQQQELNLFTDVLFFFFFDLSEFMFASESEHCFAWQLERCDSGSEISSHHSKDSITDRLPFSRDKGRKLLLQSGLQSPRNRLRRNRGSDC